MAEAHPIELESVGVVALQQLAHEGQLMVTHRGMGVVQRVVGPGLAGAARDSAQLRVAAPEVRVQVARGVVGVVHVVHPHREPG